MRIGRNPFKKREEFNRSSFKERVLGEYRSIKFYKKSSQIFSENYIIQVKLTVGIQSITEVNLRRYYRVSIEN